MLPRNGHGLQSPTDLNSKYHLATYQLVTLGKYLNLIASVSSAVNEEGREDYIG